MSSSRTLSREITTHYTLSTVTVVHTSTANRLKKRQLPYCITFTQYMAHACVLVRCPKDGHAIMSTSHKPQGIMWLCNRTVSPASSCVAMVTMMYAGSITFVGKLMHAQCISIKGSTDICRICRCYRNYSSKLTCKVCTVLYNLILHHIYVNTETPPPPPHTHTI